MGQIFFFMKALVMTLIFVFLLQIRVGQSTIEEHTVHWFQASAFSQPLGEVAQGGVVVIRNLWNRLTSGIQTKFWESTENINKPGMRELKFKLERSRKYLAEKAEKAAEQAKEKISEEDVVEWLEKSANKEGQREPEPTF